MDYTPVQLLHAVRLGLREPVLGCSTIWLCASCETCLARCPQDVDLVHVMDSLRAEAVRSGVKPAVPEVAAFYRAGLRNIHIFGRTYELGLIGQLKLATRQFGRDLKLGPAMLKRRKLNILPHFGSLGRAMGTFSRAQKLEPRR